MTKRAERLKQLIDEAKAGGLTKSKIARAMGITPQHLSNLIGGKNEWRLSQIERLCEVLDISLAQAFFEPGEDMELYVLLKNILDSGPEPRFAIAWNIKAIANQILVGGPKLRSFKFPTPKKKAN